MVQVSRQTQVHAGELGSGSLSNMNLQKELAFLEAKSHVERVELPQLGGDFDLRTYMLAVSAGTETARIAAGLRDCHLSLWPGQA